MVDTFEGGADGVEQFVLPFVPDIVPLPLPRGIPFQFLFLVVVAPI